MPIPADVAFCCSRCCGAITQVVAADWDGAQWTITLGNREAPAEEAKAEAEAEAPASSAAAPPPTPPPLAVQGQKENPLQQQHHSKATATGADDDRLAAGGGAARAEACNAEAEAAPQTFLTGAEGAAGAKQSQAVGGSNGGSETLVADVIWVACGDAVDVRGDAALSELKAGGFPSRVLGGLPVLEARGPPLQRTKQNKGRRGGAAKQRKVEGC